jgi:glycosyltransferase involved in cell wall biosynthesis
MKIAYLCHEYPPAPHGGIGTSVQTLARGFAARGHAISVIGVYPQRAGHSNGRGRSSPLPRAFSRRAARVYRDGDVRVIQLAAATAPKVGWLLDRLRLRRCLRDLAVAGEIDLVEAPDWQGTAWPSVGCVPTIIRFNGTTVTFGRLMGKRSSRLIQWLEGRGLHAADRHVAVSRFIARETAADFGLREEQIPVIPNSIDPQRFTPPPPGSREAALVVCVGMVTEKKGVVELVRAWPQVVARCREARLAIIGRDGRHAATGRSMTAVLQEMLPPEAAPTVTFTGAVPHAEAKEWLRRATVAVYPTFVEALPLVWLEAMATGTPLVGSRWGPGEEVVEHGESGLLCDPRNAEELTSHLIECLGDPALRERLGAAGRQRVMDRFATDVVLPQNEAFYSSAQAFRHSGVEAVSHQAKDKA